MTPQVSIIVPVYNVEPHLMACLDALRAQTLKDIEIICIDDASTDCSPALLKTAALLDLRIKVLRHPVNRGLSAARNTGLAAATAPWVLFIDSDDLVSSRICERTTTAALVTESDAVFFAHAVFMDGSKPPAEPIEIQPVSASQRMLLARPAFAWTKLVKRSLLIEKSIEFPEGFCFEDVPVHWKIALEAQRPVFLNEALVWYRQRQGSITYRKDWSRADGLRTYDLVRDWLQSTGRWKEYSSDFLQRESANFANTYAYYAIANPSLLPRLLEAIRSRMTVAHWEQALDRTDLLSWQRNFLLARCRPTACSFGLEVTIATIRHFTRDYLRRVYHLLRR
jgi:glycosyltransferase involved in cell wall biosynthesis